MFEAVCLGLAFVMGSCARFLQLPPLVGFLAAGFVLSYVMQSTPMPESTPKILEHLAHIGVLLLLFTVGLKIKIKQVFTPIVIGSSLAHFGLSSLIFSAFMYGVFDFPWEKALLIGFALSFSSTVLAAKLLETKKELRLFHGRISIGILIAQDIIAMAILAIWAGQKPNIWALCLLFLPWIRKGLYRVIDMTGHGEMLIIFSMLAAVIIGGNGFALMGLSPEIGALVLGVLVANHPRAKEIANSLWSLKELFLVGFFLNIGLAGLPTANDVFVALCLAVAIPVKSVLFFGLLTKMNLRSRTAFLSSLTLSSYSEFGLILLATLFPEFVTTLALAVTFSFIIAAPINRFAHTIFAKYQEPLGRFQSTNLHPDEQPKDLGDADILVFGMGRTGTAAYKFLESEGWHVVGLDADNYLIEKHQAENRRVFFADAEDNQFWGEVNLDKLKSAVLAMNDIEAKLFSARTLRKLGFSGPIISHALHEDHQMRIREAGASHTYLTMTQAGIGLAENTILALKEETDQQAA